MATVTLPYPDFVNGTAADADAVDADFAALKTFLQSSVPHCDGTNAFTGLPTLPSATPTGYQAVSKAHLDASVRGRNAVINGAFAYGQRGLGPWTASGSYTADMWKLSSSGSTFSTTRTAHTVGGIAGVKESGYFLRTVVTSSAGASNFVAVQHPIEGVASLAGQTVTLSWYAKADAAKPMAVELFQNFGTGGSPSAAVSGIGTTKVTLSATWARYTATFLVPSIVTKTIGTNGDDSLLVLFWFDAGSTFNSRTGTLGQQSGTFDLDCIQLEMNTGASLFEQDALAVLVQKCQRYLQTIGSNDAFGTATTAANATLFRGLAEPMRAAPTVTVPGSLTNALYDFVGATTRTPTAVTPTATPTNVVLACTGAASMTVGGATAWQGGTIYLSAEL